MEVFKTIPAEMHRFKDVRHANVVMVYRTCHSRPTLRATGTRDRKYSPAIEVDVELRDMAFRNAFPLLTFDSFEAERTFSRIYAHLYALNPNRVYKCYTHVHVLTSACML
jgi:hypothetical protein